jgi:iron-sulfur cluster repair protein YtfE (RIC family)
MGICGAGCKGRCGSLFGKGLLYCGHPKVLTVAFRSARPEAELRFLPRPRVVGPGGPMIDTSDMLFAHRVFRRELRSAPELIGGVEAGDTKRSALVADHLGYIVAGLHHHHAAEDELLWPPLRTRVPSSDATIQQMEEAHAAIAESVETVQTVRTPWRISAGRELAAQLIGATEDLSATVDTHLEDEERNILPLISQHITANEWKHVVKRGAEFLPKNKMALVFLGLTLQNLTPDEQRQFLAGIPTAARILWKLFGDRTFDSYRAKLDGVTQGR